MGLAFQAFFCAFRAICHQINETLLHAALRPFQGLTSFFLLWPAFHGVCNLGGFSLWAASVYPLPFAVPDRLCKNDVFHSNWPECTKKNTARRMACAMGGWLLDLQKIAQRPLTIFSRASGDPHRTLNRREHTSLEAVAQLAQTETAQAR